MGFSGKLGQALTAKEILDLVRADLQKVESEISLESVASVDAITSIGKYVHSNGGKRVRPTLLLLCCRMLGEPGETAIRLAAVIEMVHSATLVHDDVIDTAETRRGRPSTNAIWGNQTSVLAGDWLYMQAFQMALRERSFHVIDLLIGLTQMMVEGELLQLERVRKIDISEADYMELVDRKTASLFAVAARLGAYAAGADEKIESRLSEYGWNLGIAFQLVDDILDFTSREAILGKPVGRDLEEGKVTLPVIYALQDADRAERAMIETVLRESSYRRVSFGEVTSVIEKYNGIARARERAQLFTEKARKIMREFPESPYQRALIAITDLMTDRDR
jgi:octaprenyl-diphosphate synthase